MKKYFSNHIAALLIFASFFLVACQQQTASQIPITNKAMKLISSAFENNGSIPSQNTCDGQNLNPPLSISEVPAGTKSLVLIVDDPDAPAGDWVHWLVWNIPAAMAQIAEGTVPPDSVQGQTDFGNNSYGGPCPPSGVHRYQFKLYALDTTLDLPASSKKADVEKAMNEHVLDSTVLVGQYQKK